MSQHDYSIANQAGSLFRTDLNNAFAAIVSTNSGASEPTNKFAYMLWADTTSGWLKQRNATNTAWISIYRMSNSAGTRVPVIAKSSTYTVAETDFSNLIRATATLTFNLTAAATLGDGWWCDLSASGGTVTVDPNGSEQVDNNPTATLNDGETATLYCDGSGFRISRASGVPVGTIIDYTGTAAPTGYLLCFGQSVSTATYSALFAAWGSAYLYGGSAGNMNLPDCRGRAVVGKDDMGGSAANRVTVGVSGITGTTLGSVGGSEYLHSHSHTGTTGTESADHSHNFSDYYNYSAPWLTITYVGGGSGNIDGGSNNNYFINVNAGETGLTTPNNTVGRSNAHTHSFTSATAGSGSSQNMPPSIVLNKCIKV